MRAMRRSHTSGLRVPWLSSSASAHYHPPPRCHAPPYHNPTPCTPIPHTHLPTSAPCTSLTPMPTILHPHPYTAHRYATNGGQSELCKGVGGPNKKLFYQVNSKPSPALVLALTLVLVLVLALTLTLTLTLALTLTLTLWP